jgi:hypothetical protein
LIARSHRGEIFQFSGARFQVMHHSPFSILPLQATPNGEKRMIQTANKQSYLTPGEIAKACRVGVNKVLSWIRSGELRALNLAANANGERPRWRVPAEEWEAFQARRAVSET